MIDILVSRHDELAVVVHACLMGEERRIPYIHFGHVRQCQFVKVPGHNQPYLQSVEVWLR